MNDEIMIIAIRQLLEGIAEPLQLRVIQYPAISSQVFSLRNADGLTTTRFRLDLSSSTSLLGRQQNLGLGEPRLTAMWPADGQEIKLSDPNLRDILTSIIAAEYRRSQV